MMTAEQAMELLEIPKWIVEKENLLAKKELVLRQPIDLRMDLSSEDEENRFIIQIKQSKKQLLRLSIHCREGESNIGLLRVDFGAGHRNPVELTEAVPVRFVPYRGCNLEEYPGHIHYPVDGYPSLAWAIPIDADQFSLKVLNTIQDIPDAINAFIKMVKVMTVMNIQAQLKLLP